MSLPADPAQLLHEAVALAGHEGEGALGGAAMEEALSNLEVLCQRHNTLGTNLYNAVNSTFCFDPPNTLTGQACCVEVTFDDAVRLCTTPSAAARTGNDAHAVAERTWPLCAARGCVMERILRSASNRDAGEVSAAKIAELGLVLRGRVFMTPSEQQALSTRGVLPENAHERYCLPCIWRHQVVGYMQALAGTLDTCGDTFVQLVASCPGRGGGGFHKDWIALPGSVPAQARTGHVMPMVHFMRAGVRTRVVYNVTTRDVVGMALDLTPMTRPRSECASLAKVSAHTVGALAEACARDCEALHVLEKRSDHTSPLAAALRLDPVVTPTTQNAPSTSPRPFGGASAQHCFASLQTRRRALSSASAALAARRTSRAWSACCKMRALLYQLWRAEYAVLRQQLLPRLRARLSARTTLPTAPPQPSAPSKTTTSSTQAAPPTKRCKTGSAAVPPPPSTVAVEAERDATWLWDAFRAALRASPAPSLTEIVMAHLPFGIDTVARGANRVLVMAQKSASKDAPDDAVALPDVSSADLRDAVLLCLLRGNRKAADKLIDRHGATLPFPVWERLWHEAYWARAGADGTSPLADTGLPPPAAPPECGAPLLLRQYAWITAATILFERVLFLPVRVTADDMLMQLAWVARDPQALANRSWLLSPEPLLRTLPPIRRTRAAPTVEPPYPERGQKCRAIEHALRVAAAFPVQAARPGGLTKLRFYQQPGVVFESLAPAVAAHQLQCTLHNRGNLPMMHVCLECLNDSVDQSRESLSEKANKWLLVTAAGGETAPYCRHCALAPHTQSTFIVSRSMLGVVAWFGVLGYIVCAQCARMVSLDVVGWHQGLRPVCRFCEEPDAFTYLRGGGGDA